FLKLDQLLIVADFDIFLPFELLPVSPLEKRKRNKGEAYQTGCEYPDTGFPLIDFFLNLQFRFFDDLLLPVAFVSRLQRIDQLFVVDGVKRTLDLNLSVQSLRCRSVITGL